MSPGSKPHHIALIRRARTSSRHRAGSRRRLHERLRASVASRSIAGNRKSSRRPRKPPRIVCGPSHIAFDRRRSIAIRSTLRAISTSCDRKRKAKSHPPSPRHAPCTRAPQNPAVRGPSVASSPKTWVLCGGGGPSAAPPLLRDVPHRLRRGDLHPARRRSQITHVFRLDTTLAPAQAEPRKKR